VTKSPNRPTGPGKQSGNKPSDKNSTPAKPASETQSPETPAAPKAAPVAQKAVAKPETTAKPEATPQTTQDAKPDPKPDAKPDAKPEAKQPAARSVPATATPSAPTAQPSPPVKRAAERGSPARSGMSATQPPAPAQTSVSTLVAAGLVGGLIAGAGFIAYDLMMRAPPVDQSARIAAIEERVERVAQRETVAPDALGDVDSRLAAVEAQASEALATAQEVAGRTIPEVPTDAIEANTEAVSTLENELATLQGGLSAMQGTVEGLSSETAAIQAAFTPQWRDAASQAVAANHVVSAIAEGRPYPQAFQTLSALGVSANYLAAIEPFAQQGAPGSSDLVVALRGAIGEARTQQAAAAPQPPDVGGGFLQRLAERAITVEIVDVERPPTPQMAPNVEAALVTGDFEAALAGWEQLPEAVRNATQDWAQTLRQRINAAQAADAIGNEAIAALAVGR
jgi:hypothetical protein